MNILVMGLGRFGGGIGVVRWLAGNYDCHMLVTDLAGERELERSISQITDLVRNQQVKLRLGEHCKSDFYDCDLVIVNPAVSQPWNNHFLQIARKNGIPVTTEIRLLIESIPVEAKFIGVTGTAGKSTTAAMIHHIINSTGQRVHLGGNIGGSLLGTEIIAGDVVVLELSSAMLYWLGKDRDTAFVNGWSPDIGVITNLEPNHLDWHGSLDHYYESKLNILRYQMKCSNNDMCAFAGEGKRVELLASEMGITVPAIHDCKLNKTRTANDSFALPDKYQLLVPGPHNLQNANLAACVARYTAGISYEKAIQSLLTFSGLPHRLQLVGIDSKGRRYFNDSKSTTPEATVLAVKAFANEDCEVHLIVGGYDKGLALDAIIQLMENGLAGMYTIGATGLSLTRRARKLSIPDCVLQHCYTLETAVNAAVANMRAGDILLMSPGCASWDQYVNFEDRGKEFLNLVTRLTDIQ